MKNNRAYLLVVLKFDSDGAEMQEYNIIQLILITKLTILTFCQLDEVKKIMIWISSGNIFKNLETSMNDKDLFLIHG